MQIDPAGYRQWSEDGLTLAEHPGLDVRVIVVPPERMPDGAREHHHKSAVYINTQPGLVNAEGRVPYYAGEGAIVKRFRAHAEEVHLQDLTWGYVIDTHRPMLAEERGYLESLMYTMALCGAVNVAPRNRRPPVRPRLPAHMRVAMDLRARVAWDILARVGAPFATLEAPIVPAPESPVFSLHTRLPLSARGFFRQGQFWLARGAEVRKCAMASLKDGVRHLTARLRRTGQLVDVGPHQVTTADLAFGQSSTASCLVLQSEASGRRFWRVPTTGETLGDWLDRQVGR